MAQIVGQAFLAGTHHHPDFAIMGGRWVRAIPWAFIAPHAQQAVVNHAQSLERLAQRGGLSPREALAVIKDCVFEAGHGHRESEAEVELIGLVWGRKEHTP